MSYLTDEVTRRSQDVCSLCSNKKKARGWCSKHYIRWVRHGDPSVVLPPSGPALTPSKNDDRFWDQVASCTRDRLVLPRLAALPGYLTNLPSILLGRPFLPSFGDASRTLLNRIPKGDRRRLYDTLVPDSGIVGREIALTGVPVDASRVRCPMICLVGLEDNITPARSVRRVARKYGADLREYPDHAHWLPEEPGWEGIARDILAWIEEHALAEAASTSREPSEQPIASAQG